MKVEVKGTTSAILDAVLMTANEVALHTAEHGKTALALVSNIELDQSASPPTASGGKLELFNPWRGSTPLFWTLVECRPKLTHPRG
ncbi:hypothetical protein [Chromatocurvus halotolerans]|uniref:hypothetical protein n=1 Tax=Chromatocurvus halotolerans TaxID=1132028 RepID=UPI000E3E91C5